MKLVRKHFVSRIIILIVIITMVVEGVPTSWNFGFGSLKAEAKTIGVVQMGSLFAGAEIGDGQIYTVTGNQTISASEVSQNGLIVKANSTATIYIPKGSTLTVNGYSASEKTAATAAILLRQGSTLIITGEGTLKANGGNAAGGRAGYNGENGAYNSYAGAGGTGGYGGGGAGAAIGTNGGTGGAGGAGGARAYSMNSYNIGKKGGNAGGVSSAGTLYVLSTVTVIANGGTAGAGGTAGDGGYYCYGDKGSGRKKENSNATGGGGGGGGGGYAAAAIGTGGYGGAGGGGGAGGRRDEDSGNYFWSGHGGYGGYGGNIGENGINGRVNALYNYNSLKSKIEGHIAGGASGDGGYSGSSITVYKASTASVSGNTGITTSSCNSHSAIAFTLKFDYNTSYPADSTAGETANIQSTLNEYYGMTQFTSNTKVSVPTRTGYVFNGYYTESTCSNKVFDNQGKAILDSMRTNNLIDSDNRWFKNTDVTLYAGWTPASYSCLLNANGGQGGTSVTMIYDGKLVTGITPPIKTGYVFNGYYLYDSATSSKMYYYNENMQPVLEPDRWLWANNSSVLYADWIPCKYDINIYSNDDIYGVGGASGFIKTIKDSEYGNLILPTAEELGLERDHYDFIGWNIYDNQNWAMFEPNVVNHTGLSEGEPVAVYAAWNIKDNYTITYNANGGGSVPINGNAFKGEDYTVAEAASGYPGYTFVKWSITPNGTGTSYQPGEVIMGVGANITLYAIWEKNKSVSYNANGGSFTSNMDVIYPGKGETVNVELADDKIPTKTGYVFKGWSDVQSATEGKYTKNGTHSFAMPEHDVILYAVWEKEQYSIEYSTSDIYSFGTNKPVSVLYKDNYEFDVIIDTKQVDTTDMFVTINNVTVPKVTPSVDDEKIATYHYSVISAVSNQIVSVNGLSEKRYYVSLDTNGGTITDTGLATYKYSETESVSLPSVARTGYTFEGWYEREDFSGASVECIPAKSIGDVSFYAKWSANSYTVKFDGNGCSGIVADDMNATYDVTFPLPTKGGMSYSIGEGINSKDVTFLGWSTDADATIADYQPGEKIKNLCDGTNGHSEITLYAVWDLPLYLISYDLNGGNGNYNSSSVKAGKNYRIGVYTFEDGEDKYYNVDPEREGYIFTGWKDTVNEIHETGSYIISVSKATKLTAQWEAIDYKVTYSVELPEDTDEFDYFLVDGDDEEVNVEDIYPINVDATYDETLTTAGIPYRLMKKPTEPEDAEPVEAGSFVGWAKSKNATSPEFMLSQQVKNLTKVKEETVNLYAVISDSSNNYLFYDCNGGEWDASGVQPTQFGSGDVTVMFDKAPHKANYVFAGWKNGGDLYTENGSDKTIDLSLGSVTLYAEYTPVTYEVVFDAGNMSDDIDPSVTMDNQVLTYDEIDTLNACAYTADWYDFTGWKLNKDNMVPDYVDGDTVKNLPFEFDETLGKNVVTLYAEWELRNPTTLIFNANGGENSPSSETVSKGQTVDINADMIPVREGYIFKGWSGDEAALTADYVYSVDGATSAASITPSSITLNSNTVLYAVWEKRPVYKVRYEKASGSNGSAPVDVNTYYEGDNVEVKITSIPTLTGYVFSGWKNNSQIYGIGENARFTVSADMADENGIITLVQAITPIEYNVNFHDRGNVLNEEPIVFVYDGEIPDLSSINIDSRVGYTYKGWALNENGAVAYENNDELKNLSSIENSTIDLYAVWTPNTNKITLYDGEDATGGAGEVTAIYDEQLPVVASIPTRYGYTFAGYYIESKCYYDASLNPKENWKGTSDITLYAKWVPAEYEVIYMYDGEVLAKQKAYHGSDIIILSDAICKEGTIASGQRKLSGWSQTGTKGDGVKVYKPGVPEDMWNVGNGSDVILYAVIVKDTKYHVSYNANGGAGIPMDYNDYEEDDKATVKYYSGISKTDYVFKGWSLDPNALEPSYTEDGADNTLVINGDMTLYAVWEIGTYTITYKANDLGGNLIAGASNVVTVNRGASEIPFANALYELEGFTLQGWSTSKSKSNGVTADLGGPITSTMTALDNYDLYTVWTPNVVDVDFDTCGGEEIETMKVTYGTNYGNLPAATKDGYSFVGWYKNYDIETGEYSDRVFNSTIVDNSNGITLYAKYEGDNYQVIYNMNYGENATVIREVNVLDDYRLANDFQAEGYERDGYVLLGYALSKGAKAYVYEPNDRYQGVKNGRYNMYCIWEPVSYYVSFDPCNTDKTTAKGEMEDIKLTCGETIKLPANTFEREGYSFLGWSLDGENVLYEDEETVKDLSYNEGEIVILKAVWKKNVLKRLEIEMNSSDYECGQTYISFDSFLQDARVILYYMDGSQKDVTDIVSIDKSRVNPNVPGTYKLTCEYSQKVDGVTETIKGEGLVNVYQKGKVSVSYLDDGSDAGTVPSPKVVASGDSVTIAKNEGNLIKYGHTFVGWNTESDGTGDEYLPGAVINKLTESLILYPEWEVTKYQLTIDSDDGIDKDSILVNGEEPNDEGYSYDENITVSIKTVPDRKFYKFVSSNEEVVESGTGLYNEIEDRYEYSFKMPQYSFTIKASTETVITLHGNNGEYAKFAIETSSGEFEYVTETDVECAIDSILDQSILPIPVNSLSGYEFNGWFLDENCQTILPADYVAEGCTDIYAGWGYKANAGEMTVLKIDDMTYTGTAIKPTVVVMDGDKILTQGIDYTISYSNNKVVNKVKVECNNLSVSDSSIVENLLKKGIKVPTATIKGKGNYKGTIKMGFNIVPKNISYVDTDSEMTLLYDTALKQSKSAQKDKIVLTYKASSSTKSNTLKIKTDYTVMYYPVDGENKRIESAGSTAVPKNGTGTYEMVVTAVEGRNYTGEFVKRIFISSETNNLAKASISTKAYTFSENKAMTEEELLSALSITVKLDKKQLKQGSDYELEFMNGRPSKPGTYMVNVKAKAGSTYEGSKSVKVKFKAVNTKKVKISMVSNAVYNGQSYGDGIVSISNNGTPMFKNYDYTVKVNGGVNCGTTKVTITGKGIYTGYKKNVSYKIGQYNLKEDTSKLIIVESPKEPVEYNKKGAKPDVKMMFGSKELKQGVDYTLKYANNKTVTSSAEATKKPSITIIGKGNFKGTISGGLFEIKPRTLNDVNIEASISDYLYKKTENTGLLSKNGKFTLVDVSDGSKLVAGKDYSKESVTYEITGDSLYERIPSKLQNIGRKVKVTVSGCGNYSGTYSFETDIAGQELKKVSCNKITKIYTGSDIRLTEEDLGFTYKLTSADEVAYFANYNNMYIQAKGATEESVKENCYYKKGQSTEAKPTASFNIGDEIILKAGRDYDLENAHYINNVKKGTATVKIEGNGFFGNSKSIRYKINQKDIKWWNGN